jgi:hypothetical protein
MACGSCGNDIFNNNHNCENPCHRTVTNTPECESLPSQISNFTTQFFGVVVKTEINGQVVWSLPCSLDVGLPANPRGSGEGLACYFLRLFMDGIIGLTGPKGAPGNPGTNGNNAYTVTLHGFTQPTTGAPNIQVSTAFNPAILTNSYVFIGSSGYYLVTNADNSGTLFLQLVQAVPGASGTITAGKIVNLSGPPGPAITGPVGPQGVQGIQGPPGEVVTLTNGYYFSTTGSNFDLPAVYAAVNFTTSSPAVLLPAVGTYLMTAVVTVAGLGGVTTADAAIVKLRNTSSGIDVPGSEQNITYLSPTQYSQITINARVTTTGANQTVALFGKATGAGIITAVALNTTVTFVRIA